MQNMPLQHDRTVFVAAAFGAFVLERREEAWTRIRAGHEAEYVTSVAAIEGEVLAGTHHGTFRSVRHP